MAESIRTVTDKTQFEMIFTKFFSGKDIFLKTKSGNLKIHYLGFKDDNVAFRIPYLKNTPETVIIFIRHNANTIYASLKYLENNEDTFVFIPIKFQIISDARKEDRALTQVEGSGTNIVYFSNIMSDYAMKNEIYMHQKKVDNIKETVAFDLQKQFERIRLFFISEGQSDSRMKYVLEKNKPILIYDLNSSPSEKDQAEFNNYVNEIYLKDYRLSSNKEFISEATVPILYKNMIPYGYLQVNKKTPMTDGLFTVVKRMAVVVNELFRKEKMFIVEDDKFLVSDLSQGGLSVVFKERRQIRFFRQDSLVTGEIILPTSKKATIGAIVRNITFLDNGIIKAGMQIVNMDAISEVNYEEYLESIEK